MKRFYINCYTSQDKQFQVNTYCTSNVEKVKECVSSLLSYSEHGLCRIEILDATKTLPLLTMAPWDLDAHPAR